MILVNLQTTITGSKSIIGFQTESGGSWSAWDRFLTIDGKKAFHIGNVCGTCTFFFERLAGANRSINPDDVVDKLNGGLTGLDSITLNALEPIMPDGKYLVLLQTVSPRLVQPGENGDYFKEEQIDLWGMDGFWGMPHFPKTEYYRLLTKTMKEGRSLFEFLIPIFPHGWLNEQRLSEYETSLNEDAMPTAVAISVLDVKAPADSWDEGQNITSHWCLGHYLVDGHHKVYAAAMKNKPLTLVSFLAVEQGISSEEEINELVEELKTD